MRWGSAPRAPSRPTRRMHTTSQPVTAHHLHAQFVNQHQSLLSPHAHKGWGSMFSVGGQLSKDAKPLIVFQVSTRLFEHPYSISPSIGMHSALQGLHHRSVKASCHR